MCSKFLFYSFSSLFQSLEQFYMTLTELKPIPGFFSMLCITNLNKYLPVRKIFYSMSITYYNFITIVLTNILSITVLLLPDGTWIGNAVAMVNIYTWSHIVKFYVNFQCFHIFFKKLEIILRQFSCIVNCVSPMLLSTSAI